MSSDIPDTEEIQTERDGVTHLNSVYSYHSDQDYYMYRNKNQAPETLTDITIHSLGKYTLTHFANMNFYVHVIRGSLRVYLRGSPSAFHSTAGRREGDPLFVTLDSRELSADSTPRECSFIHITQEHAMAHLQFDVQKTSSEDCEYRLFITANRMHA